MGSPRLNLGVVRRARSALTAWIALAVPAGALAVAVDNTALRIVVAAVAIVGLGVIAILTMHEDRATAAEELQLRLRDAAASLGASRLMGR